MVDGCVGEIAFEVSRRESVGCEAEAVGVSLLSAVGDGAVNGVALVFGGAQPSVTGGPVIQDSRKPPIGDVTGGNQHVVIGVQVRPAG